MFNSCKMIPNKSIESDLLNQKNVRLTLRLHKCDKCDKYFKSKSKLQKHSKMVHSLLRPYVCDTCNKSFERKNKLNEHKKLVHILLKLHVCDVCNKSFKLPRYLYDHKMVVHSTSKYVHVCDSCGKVFKLLRYLDRHKKLHLKLYECNDCGKTYLHKTQLLRHMPVHYSTSKLYVCDDCGLSFATVSNRNRHKKLHSALKSYRCDECYKFFKSSNSLRCHKKVHKIKSCTRDGCEQYESTFRPEKDTDSHLDSQKDKSNQEALDTCDSDINISHLATNRDGKLLLIDTHVSHTRNQSVDETSRNSNECNTDNACTFSGEQYLYSDIDEMLQQYDINDEIESNCLDAYLFSTNETTLSFIL